MIWPASFVPPSIAFSPLRAAAADAANAVTARGPLISTVDTKVETTVAQSESTPERRPAPDKPNPLLSHSAAVASALAPDPFGVATVPVVDGNIIIKWSGFEADIRGEEQILAQCREGGPCPQSAREFLAIVDEGRMQTGRARIGVINRAINLAIKATSDFEQWGVADRWSAPLETFTTHRGDCEDYAIAKYVALRAAGIPAEDLKLVVVRDTVASEDHAVTAVRFDGAWLVLDNRWLPLGRDTDISNVIPKFILDENGVRRFVVPVLNAKLRESSTVSFLH
jgi:predicted transglutaminase-like cysteine proteinase